MSDYIIKVSATNYAGAITFEDYYDLYYLKELNRISEFRFTAYSLSDAQKAVLIEGNIVYILYGTNLILKGEIRKANRDDTVDDYYIEGNGMEIKLLDRDVRGREQWDDTEADTIIKSLISGIITEGTIESAIKVGFRAEEDSVLRACVSLAKAIDWDWYVDQGQGEVVYPGDTLYPAGTLYPSPGVDFDIDKFCFIGHKGETDSQETFQVDEDIFKIDRNKDVDNVFNVVRVLGYGDGINQIMSESFYATTNRATLSAAISASGTSLTVTEDISNFSASGNLRCGREWFIYSSKNDGTKTFTISTRGNIPGTNPPTDNPYYIAAYAHKKGAEIIDLQYSNTGFATKPTAQAGTSIATYGLRDNVYPDQAIRNQTTVDLLAQRLVNKYKISVERIELTTAKESLTAKIGDSVKIIGKEWLYPADTLYPNDSMYPGYASETYRVLKLEFNYEDYSMSLVLGNAIDFFLESIGELQKKMNITSVYGLGNTCLYSVQSYENCDVSHPLHLRFFLPPEVVALNHAYLSFKIKQYRAYTGQTPAGGGHTTPSGGGSTSGASQSYNIRGQLILTKQRKDVAVCPGECATPFDCYLVTDVSSPYYWSRKEHTHTTPNHTHEVSNHTHDMAYGISEASESSPSITVKVGEDGGSLTEISGSPFAAGSNKLDISGLIKAVGTDKWIDVEFTPNQIRRIEANCYVQVFIESK